MKHKGLSILLLIILLFPSCVSTHGPDPVYLTDEKTFYLLPPEASGDAVDSYQLIAFETPGHESASFEAIVVSDDAGIDMEFFTSSGQTVASISFDGDTVSFSSPFVKALKAEYIIADLQLLLYEEKSLETALDASGLSFSVISGHRYLYDGDRLIWEAWIEEGVTYVVNHLRSYSYGIEVLG